MRNIRSNTVSIYFDQSIYSLISEDILCSVSFLFSGYSVQWVNIYILCSLSTLFIDYFVQWVYTLISEYILTVFDLIFQIIGDKYEIYNFRYILPQNRGSIILMSSHNPLTILFIFLINWGRGFLAWLHKFKYLCKFWISSFFWVIM